ncbi:MAG: hypothetical protein R3E12_08670 [Candidatus Eisenbacteria bacterium]
MPDPHDGRSHLILFVRDQDRSTDFYRHVLDREPRLHVPGMTEFPLPGGAILGLMPERSDPSPAGETVSRCRRAALPAPSST